MKRDRNNSELISASRDQEPWSTSSHSARRSIPKTQTGIRGLDTILAGGLPTSRTTILSGGPGAGKTVLALEFLYRGAVDGEAGVFVSFEEDEESLRANATAMDMDVDELERDHKLKIIHGDIPHHAIRNGEFNIQGLLAFLEGHLRLLKASRIVLDAVDVLMGIFRDRDREREEMYALYNWLHSRRLTAVLTVKSDTDGTQQYPFLHFLADCVLHVDQRIEGHIRTRRLNVVKYRGSDFLSNEHPFVFSSDGVVLIPVSSMSLTEVISDDRVSSGMDDLDEILGGGYFRGSCILVQGPSGSGKTTLASLFVQESFERDERALYISFEESQGALISGMRSVGIDLGRALEAESLRMRTRLPESAGAEEQLLWILDAMDEFAPNSLVIDAISACTRMGSDRAAFDFLTRIMTICKERGITCFYTAGQESGVAGNRMSGLGIESLVDTMITLQYFRGEEKLQRRLWVVKSRRSAHSMDAHEMVITDAGVRLYRLRNETDKK